MRPPNERIRHDTPCVCLRTDISDASSGDAAVRRAKVEQPDLIVMDLMMPGINGFEATRMLSRDEATKHIPIIICTKMNQESDRIWGLRQGAKDYVNKPIVETDLLGKIGALLAMDLVAA